MYSIFLAIRYLRSLWLTYLAVGIVFVSVFTMMVVMSVMWGLADYTRAHLRGTRSDVIVSRQRSLPIDGYPALCERIRRVKGVQAAWPFVEGFGILRQGVHSQAVQVLGVDFRDPEAVRDLRGFVKARARSRGVPEPAWPPAAEAGLLYGGKFVGIAEGEEVDLFVAANSPAFSPIPTQPSISRTQGRMAGHFLTGTYTADAYVIYMDLAQAQRLFRLNHPPSAGRLGIRLAPGAEGREVAARIQDLLDGDFRAQSWDAMSDDIIFLEIENQIICLILSAILMMAGFGILAILNMQVTHKVHEIGILKAIGGTRAGVSLIFLLSGGLIGVTGAGLASVSALSFLRNMDAIHDWLRAKTGWEFYMIAGYGTEGVPVSIRPGALTAIALGAVGVSLLAGAWPAWRATRLQPAEAFRRD